MSIDTPDGWYAWEFEREIPADLELSFSEDSCDGIEMPYKSCSACSRTLHLSEFSINENGYLARHSICRDCKASDDRERYIEVTNLLKSKEL